MDLITTDMQVGDVRVLWYPQDGFKTIIAGRYPGTLSAKPQPGEAIHWQITNLPRSFARRFLALFCDTSGSLTIVRLTAKNTVAVSPHPDQEGKHLKIGERHTVTPNEAINLTITIQGVTQTVVLKTQRVSFEPMCILSMVRQK